MANISKLKTLLAVDHPVSGPWNADDQLAADQGNALNFDAPAERLEILELLTLTRFRGSFVYGRIEMMSEAKSGDLVPLGSGSPPSDITADIQMICAAKSLLKFADLDVISTKSFTDTDFDSMLNKLALGASQAQCFDINVKSGLQSLSTNKQSLFVREGVGRVSAGHINQARQ